MRRLLSARYAIERVEEVVPGEKKTKRQRASTECVRDESVTRRKGTRKRQKAASAWDAPSVSERVLTDEALNGLLKQQESLRLFIRSTVLFVRSFSDSLRVAAQFKVHAAAVHAASGCSRDPLSSVSLHRCYSRTRSPTEQPELPHAGANHQQTRDARSSWRERVSCYRSGRREVPLFGTFFEVHVASGLSVDSTSPVLYLQGVSLTHSGADRCVVSLCLPFHSSPSRCSAVRHVSQSATHGICQHLTTQPTSQHLI